MSLPTPRRFLARGINRKFLGEEKRIRSREPQGSVWALSFNNASTYLKVLDDNSLDFNNVDFSVVAGMQHNDVNPDVCMLLMKKRDTGISDLFNNYGIFTKTTAAGANGLKLGFLAGGGPGQFQRVVGNTNIADTNKHDIGYGFDASANTLAFYLDGNSDGVKLFTVNPAANIDPLFIGKHTAGNGVDGFWLNDKIEYIAIFNRLLEDWEFKRIAENPQGELTGMPGKVLWLRFQEGFGVANGTELKDSSNEQNHPEMQGFSGSPWVNVGVR